MFLFGMFDSRISDQRHNRNENNMNGKTHRHWFIHYVCTFIAEVFMNLAWTLNAEHWTHMNSSVDSKYLIIFPVWLLRYTPAFAWNKQQKVCFANICKIALRFYILRCVQWSEVFLLVKSSIDWHILSMFNNNNLIWYFFLRYFSNALQYFKILKQVRSHARPMNSDAYPKLFNFQLHWQKHFILSSKIIIVSQCCDTRIPLKSKIANIVTFETLKSL